jgi:hypothetical protein
MKIGLLIVAIMAMLTYQIDGRFPSIRGETVDSKMVTVPDNLNGKRAVVGIAFSLKADESLKKWAQPLFNQLLGGNFGGMMTGNMYNANLCFVGMFKGVSKLGINDIKQKSKKNIDSKLHPYFVISEDDANSIINQLKIKEKGEPHFFVIDEKGIILNHVHGDYSESKMDEITGALLN